VTEPWNLTEAQRRQFREARAEATQRQNELRQAADDATIPRHEFTAAHELHLFPLDMCEIACPDCEQTSYPDDLGEAVDWALGHQCPASWGSVDGSAGDSHA
jgi:hypothetical protein